MKVVRKLAVLAIGFIFFIAGLFKLMDPVGAGLVVGDYFSFFHVSFLHFASFPIALALALFETLLGAALLTGVWPGKVAVVSGIALAFFTLVSFILWIGDPPMDCGCFGEAIHLSHAQTLVKNLILVALWCAAFLPLGSVCRPAGVKFVSFSIAAVSVAAFCVYSLISLPMVDYTPFRTGTELGTEQEGLAEPLSIIDADGEYADSVLVKGKILLLSVYSPNQKVLKKVAEYRQELETKGINSIVLASGDPEDMFAAEPYLNGITYLADRRTLMTLNRGNGGATYVCNGQIVRKWSVNFLPGGDELSGLLEQTPIEAVIKENSADRKWLQGFFLYAFAVMLLL